MSILISQPLPETENLSLPYIFVGDEAFFISQYIMRSYDEKILSEEEKIFNYRLSRARKVYLVYFLTNGKFSIHPLMEV